MPENSKIQWSGNREALRWDRIDVAKAKQMKGKRHVQMCRLGTAVLVVC